MSGQQAAREPYTTRFESEVTAVDGRDVWLETSYFYAAGDGQPADRGTIGDVEVADVRYENGEGVHRLAEPPSFKAGHRVLCRIDWSFRMYCMRSHTAAHVLYGAARSLCEDLEYDDLEIGPETIRLDIRTSTEIGDDLLIELNELINRIVWESRSVSWEDVPIADARERSEVVFDETSTETARENGRVRVVTIGGEDGNDRTTTTIQPWDVAACGGTHVRNTREIGPVTVRGGTDLGGDRCRLELAVGPSAIEHRSHEKRAALAAERALEVDLTETPDALEGLPRTER